MRVLAVFLGFSALAGCAGVYSKDAIPGAMAAYNLNMDRCKQQIGQVELAASMKCVLDTDQQFAIDIKLKRMDLFKGYAARMVVLYEDTKAGRVKEGDFGKRYADIRRDYFRSIDQAADIDAEKRERAAAAFAAFGAAMERQADRQAYINAQNRPVNCTSQAFGSVVNTRCN